MHVYKPRKYNPKLSQHEKAALLALSDAVTDYTEG